MKTTVIENFLSDDEIFEIEKTFRLRHDTVMWKEPTEHENMSHALYWYPGPSYQQELCTYINDKINKHFPNNICDNWHTLHAYKPYGIHTDSLDENLTSYTHSLPDNTNFGWTFLIPLDNYNTNTIVFNEGSDKMKVSTNWIERENRSPQGLISNETHEKYLTHQGKDLVDYFSIDTIFPWKKGNLLAMPRTSFHCSDNFTIKNMFEKRALIGWSLMLKELL
jgi:hypothetical protein